MNRMVWRHVCSAALASIVWMAAVAVPAARAVSVSGTVRDAVTLDPVPGFNLTLHVIDPDSIAISTISGPGGDYVIDGAPGGNQIYVLTGYGPVYAGYYARLPVPDPALTFDVLLDSLYVPDPGDPPDSSSVFGRILTTSDERTQGIANATVTLSSGGASYLGSTDAGGQYSVILPPGVYAAHVAADGYLPVTDSGIEAGAGGFSYNAILEHSTAGVPHPDVLESIALRAIRPNPLRFSAEIQFALAAAGPVELAVFDPAGREVSRVLSGWLPAGPHVAAFSAARLPAGVYFCRLEAARHVVTKRFAIVP